MNDVDAREVRTNRVSRLYGEITSATREFLRAVVVVDRHEDWREEGFGSCGEWLANEIGIKRGAANEKVRAARALESLPTISRAMDRGKISFSKVRALTRVATPENEEALLEYAEAGSAATLERLVRGWKTLGRSDEAKLEQLRDRSRRLSVFPDNDTVVSVDTGASGWVMKQR